MPSFRLPTAAGIFSAGVFALTGIASAQVPEPWPTHRRGDGYTYYREYRSPGPQRGFEGFAGPGPNLRYCSYRRTPNRVCDRRGCRVQGWTLEQYCY
ncbi:MAG TPA: hypothetical protein VFV47_09190 [Hyphomicrobiaceae bacterium]|nr:hypothetical protein [Hyphomicrobiaceae bacterium]